jgi:hypothetical protein
VALPEVVKVERLVAPVTVSPALREVLEVTVNDPPTETFPVVVRVAELILLAFTFPSWDSPVTESPPKEPILPTLKDEPTPTLLVTPKEFKEVVPETFKVERAAVELGTTNDPPTFTFPVRLDNPVTFNPPFKAESPPTVKDNPIPVLPVTLNDPPTPRKLERYPEPTTSSSYRGEVVLIPTFPPLVTTNGLALVGFTWNL